MNKDEPSAMNCRFDKWAARHPKTALKQFQRPVTGRVVKNGEETGETFPARHVIRDGKLTIERI